MRRIMYKKGEKKRIQKMWIWIVEMWKYYKIRVRKKMYIFWFFEFLYLSVFYAYIIRFKWMEWRFFFFSIENNMQLAHTDGKYFRFRYKYLTLLFEVSDARIVWKSKSFFGLTGSLSYDLLSACLKFCLMEVWILWYWLFCFVQIWWHCSQSWNLPKH